jgi:hypothetical protein
MPLSAIEFVEASATHRQSITLMQVHNAPDAALKSEALEKKLFDFIRIASRKRHLHKTDSLALIGDRRFIVPVGGQADSRGHRGTA